MEMWLCISVGILTAIIFVLLIKIHILHKTAEEIADAFADRLITDTNTLIDISGSDRYMRRLAADINIQLRKLRSERLRFQAGDLELKNAITNISHDLRTPLTAIRGYLDLLEKEEKSEAIERYVAVIKNRTGLLIQLTEEFFNYSIILSKTGDIVIEPVAINNVLEESVAAFYTALNARNIVPVMHIPETKIILMLDRASLSRIFSNLLSNVIKYSDGDLEITLLENGEMTFSNTASDLDKVSVGNLFNRFYTVDAARKSTGLGLAISKTLIERMGGTISAEYEDGRLIIRLCLCANLQA